MPLEVEQPSRHVTLITIDNEPKRNAMSREMMSELAALWDELDGSACRCVVLTGAGDRAFCSGADLGGDMSASAETAAMVNRSLLKHSTFSKPIVAAVNGDCVAGGVELMLSTDIRYAAPQARFGLPEVRWGIYPFGGATVKLIAQIGYVHAMDLILTGRLVDAGFAAHVGLVNEVIEGDGVLDRALETAGIIAANGPVAVQAVKRQVSATIADHAMSREALEQELGDRVRASPDFQEGISAFIEKRRPDYG